MPAHNAVEPTNEARPGVVPRVCPMTPPATAPAVAAPQITVATVFAQVYQDHRWVSWVAYGTAGLIGASRVGLGRHFPSDVIVGGLLGNSIGRMVVTRDLESRPPSASLRPYFDPAGDGVGLVWTRDW